MRLQIQSAMLFAFVACSLASNAALAQDTPVEPIVVDSAVPEVEADPKAEELMARAMEYMNGLDRLGVELDLSLQLRQGDESVKRELDGEIKLAGDNQLYLVSKNEQNETRLISDGETLTIFNVSDNTYFTRPAPVRKQLIGMMGDELTRLGSAFVSAFLHNDPEMFEQATKIALAGTEEMDEKTYEKVQLEFPEFSVTAWIQSGDTPVLHQLSIDLSRAMQASIGVADASAIVEARLNAWQINPAFEESLFAFTPPEGAKEEDPADAAEEEGSAALVGQDAPAVELDLLAGGRMSLADHKGKDIVILDFWATWCGPCRRGLPIVSGVAKSFAEKNVVFYAVNIEEDPAKIRSFLESQELDFPVALDASGEAQAKYRASSIPTTIIVGKDGKVQAVHTGIGPNTEQELQEQLGTLVDGGSLL